MHLKRIGPRRTRAESADIIDLKKQTTVIGRNAAQVDAVINSTDYVQNAIISRRHARVVRRSDGTYRLFDDSRNGVFVNDIKINGSAQLNEGDTVTFGHRTGEKLDAGTRARQPDSEYQFIFEACDCRQGGNQPPQLPLRQGQNNQITITTQKKGPNNQGHNLNDGGSTRNSNSMPPPLNPIPRHHHPVQTSTPKSSKHISKTSPSHSAGSPTGTNSHNDSINQKEDTLVTELSADDINESTYNDCKNDSTPSGKQNKSKAEIEKTAIEAKAVSKNIMKICIEDKDVNTKKNDKKINDGSDGEISKKSTNDRDQNESEEIKEAGDSVSEGAVVELVTSDLTAANIQRVVTTVDDGDVK